MIEGSGSAILPVTIAAVMVYRWSGRKRSVRSGYWTTGSGCSGAWPSAPGYRPSTWSSSRRRIPTARHSYENSTEKKPLTVLLKICFWCWYISWAPVPTVPTDNCSNKKGPQMFQCSSFYSIVDISYTNVPKRSLKSSNSFSEICSCFQC